VAAAKKVPGLAIAFGQAKPGMGEDMGEVDDQVADDTEEAMTKGGQAFLEAFAAKDALGIAKAIATIKDASGDGEEE